MIIHYLKDGTVLNDITGHVIRMDENSIYTVLDSINQKRAERGEKYVKTCRSISSKGVAGA